MGQDTPDPPTHDDVLRFLPELRIFVGAACSRQRTGALPDDVVQETLLRAWTASVGNRGRADSGASWLCGIARNVIRENRRRSSRGATLFTDVSREQAEVMQAKPFEGPLPGESLDTDESNRTLFLAWETLPPPPARYSPHALPRCPKRFGDCRYAQVQLRGNEVDASPSTRGPGPVDRRAQVMAAHNRELSARTMYAGQGTVEGKSSPPRTSVYGNPQETRRIWDARRTLCKEVTR